MCIDVYCLYLNSIIASSSNRGIFAQGFRRDLNQDGVRIGQGMVSSVSGYYE